MSAHVGRARRGFALLTALAAIGVLASLAVLAQLSARIAMREVSALRAEAQAAATRESLRARATLAMARAPRAALVSTTIRIGGADTAITVTASAWPWHRVDIVAAGEKMEAEVARASVPPLWCAAIANAGVAVVAAGTVRLSATSTCAAPTATIDTAAYAMFGSAVRRDLVLPPLEGSVVLPATEARTGVIVARQRVSIADGAMVSGVVVAPDVRVGAGATVYGAIVAGDTLVVSAGAAVIGDERVALEALRGSARLRMLGTRGLLPLPGR
ncbi:MAG TPA: hypothetical protein VJR92_11340 [Gemmatimonadaceae bacterium]|nr:hypothetical protein [Gemmatimonadaceae bacterium]